MATTLTLATGPLTATVTAQNDAKAQEAIRRFAMATGAPVDATNQQLLNAAVAALAKHIIKVAKQHKLAEAEAEAMTEAGAEIGF